MLLATKHQAAGIVSKCHIIEGKTHTSFLLEVRVMMAGRILLSLPEGDGSGTDIILSLSLLSGRQRGLIHRVSTQRRTGGGEWVRGLRAGDALSGLEAQKQKASTVVHRLLPIIA